MSYNLFNNKISSKGFRINLGEVPVLQMRLSNALNEPIEIKRPTEDPGIFLYPLWVWSFYEEVAGGRHFEITNVQVLDGDKSLIGATLKKDAFQFDRNYRHQLSMRWETDPEDAWDVVAQGSIITYSPLRGHAVLST